MEALSTQQELLLDSDIENDRLGEDEKEDDSVNADEEILDGKTGNHDESSSYSEKEETLNRNRVGDGVYVEELSGNDVESSSNNNDVASLQEDLQSDSSLAVTSVAPGSLSSPISPDSDIASGSKDVDNRPASGEVLTSEPEMNILKDESDNSPNSNNNSITHDNNEIYDYSTENVPVYDNSSSNYNSSYQDEVPGSPVNEITNSSLHKFSNISGDSAKESGLFDKETVTESSKGVLNPTQTEQLLSEETASTLEQQIERGLSEAAFVSVTAYPLADDQKKNHETVMNSSAAKPELQGILFSSAGVPAPLVSAAVKTLPGKVLVPAVVDQVQGQALAALQVLKVLCDAFPNMHRNVHFVGLILVYPTLPTILIIIVSTRESQLLGG